MHRNWLKSKLCAYHAMEEKDQDNRRKILDFVETEVNCFERHLAIGHVTGSAWITNAARDKVILTHHRKLNQWLQLGGHSDGNPDTLAVAHREAEEESGLSIVQPVSREIFDVDIHLIPSRLEEGQHYHYDVRFLFVAGEDQPLTVSDESHDVAWISVDEIQHYAANESILRMVRKMHHVISKRSVHRKGDG